MNDRQRLEAIVAVVCKYLPPDGISREDAMREIIGLVDPLPEQPEQKPVCWITPDEKGFRMRYEPPINDVPLGWTALYDAPPSKPWVGLTEEERNEMIGRIQHDQYTRQRDLIGSTQIITEMYLKEKNGG